MINDPFRGDIKTLVGPDRVSWERDHGRPPIKLDSAGAPYIEQARRLVFLDHTALTADAAIAAQTDLEALCEKVLAGSKENFDLHLCYYDPETNAFWAYPLNG